MEANGRHTDPPPAPFTIANQRLFTKATIESFHAFPRAAAPRPPQTSQRRKPFHSATPPPMPIFQSYGRREKGKRREERTGGVRGLGGERKVEGKEERIGNGRERKMEGKDDWKRKGNGRETKVEGKDDWQRKGNGKEKSGEK